MPPCDWEKMKNSMIEWTSLCLYERGNHVSKVGLRGWEMTFGMNKGGYSTKDGWMLKNKFAQRRGKSQMWEKRENWFPKSLIIRAYDRSWSSIMFQTLYRQIFKHSSIYRRKNMSITEIIQSIDISVSKYALSTNYIYWYISVSKFNNPSSVTSSIIIIINGNQESIKTKQIK